MKKDNLPVKLVVIIPFFQRQEGILLKSLESINKQTYKQTIKVCIIDDESPISLDDELENFTPHPHINIIKLKQKNRGPAGARNAGLNWAELNAIDYVAFLDSDDTWSASHLENAVNMLTREFDFYFANLLQLNAVEGAFERASRLNLVDHDVLDKEKKLYSYQGDMFDQILRGNLIGTSTVAFHFSKFSLLRFNQAFVNAGEDYLFWADIVSRTADIAFCTQIEAYYGRGVNVFAGSGWGSDSYFDRLYYEIKYRKYFIQKYPLNKVQKKGMRQGIKRLRYAIFTDLVHRLSHRKKAFKPLFTQYVKEDKRFVINTVYYPFLFLIKKLKSKAN